MYTENYVNIMIGRQCLLLLDNVTEGGPQRFDLVRQAMFLTQTLGQWRHLVQVVAGHRREKTENTKKLSDQQLGKLENNQEIC